MRHSTLLVWLLIGLLLLAVSGTTFSTPSKSILAQSATEPATPRLRQSPRAFPLSTLQSLTAKNAGQIVSLARLGHGSVSSLTWSADARKLLVASSAGVWLYTSDHLDGLPDFLPDLVSDVSSAALSPD